MSKLNYLKENKGIINLEDNENKTLFLINEKDSIDFNISLKDYSSLNLQIVNKYASNNEVKVKITADLMENSTFKLVLIDFSSKKMKAEVFAEIHSFAYFEANVASTSSNTEEKIFDIRANHAYKNGSSLVKMYGVITDKGSLSFLGDSNIEKGAIKVSTRQEGHIADLSKGGKANVSPMLRIAENDIKASHGATLGKIPDESLFYLMSRGLTKEEATSLMTIGFLKPIVNLIEDEKVRDELLDYVNNRSY